MGFYKVVINRAFFWQFWHLALYYFPMKNILIVDDSKVTRQVIKNTCNAMGLESNLIEAENGKIALEKLTEEVIDLVLLDWNMPEMSGLEFLKEVRSKPAYERLPIIMVTSEAAHYNIVEALKSGASDYMVKPISLHTLQSKLKKLKFI